MASKGGEDKSDEGRDCFRLVEYLNELEDYTFSKLQLQNINKTASSLLKDYLKRLGCDLHLQRFSQLYRHPKLVSIIEKSGGKHCKISTTLLQLSDEIQSEEKNLQGFLKISECGKFNLVGIKNKTSGEKYLLKVIDKFSIFQTIGIHQLHKEFEVSTSGHHLLHNIIYSYNKKDEVYFLYEYSEGNIMSLLASPNTTIAEPHLTINQIRYYVPQLVVAVNAMHKFGIMHRSITPDCVLLSSSGNIKLSNFASAGVLWHQTSLVRCTDNLKKNNFMAPELMKIIDNFESGSESVWVDKDCDYYSLGMVIHCFYNGFPYFDGDDADILTDSSLYASNWYENVLTALLKWDEVPQDLKVLLTVLLRRQSEIELTKLKKLQFFNEVKWNTVGLTACPFEMKMPSTGAEEDICLPPPKKCQELEWKINSQCIGFDFDRSKNNIVSAFALDIEEEVNVFVNKLKLLLFHCENRMIKWCKYLLQDNINFEELEDPEVSLPELRYQSMVNASKLLIKLWFYIKWGILYSKYVSDKKNKKSLTGNQYSFEISSFEGISDIVHLAEQENVDLQMQWSLVFEFFDRRNLRHLKQRKKDTRFINEMVGDVLSLTLTTVQNFFDKHLNLKQDIKKKSVVVCSYLTDFIVLLLDNFQREVCCGPDRFPCRQLKRRINAFIVDHKAAELQVTNEIKHFLYFLKIIQRKFKDLKVIHTATGRSTLQASKSLSSIVNVEQSKFGTRKKQKTSEEDKIVSADQKVEKPQTFQSVSQPTLGAISLKPQTSLNITSEPGIERSPGVLRPDVEEFYPRASTSQQLTEMEQIKINASKQEEPLPSAEQFHGSNKLDKKNKTPSDEVYNPGLQKDFLINTCSTYGQYHGLIPTLTLPTGNLSITEYFKNVLRKHCVTGSYPLPESRRGNSADEEFVPTAGPSQRLTDMELQVQHESSLPAMRPFLFDEEYISRNTGKRIMDTSSNTDNFLHWDEPSENLDLEALMINDQSSLENLNEQYVKQFQELSYQANRLSKQSNSLTVELNKIKRISESRSLPDEAYIVNNYTEQEKALIFPYKKRYLLNKPFLIDARMFTQPTLNTTAKQRIVSHYSRLDPPLGRLTRRFPMIIKSNYRHRFFVPLIGSTGITCYSCCGEITEFHFTIECRRCKIVIHEECINIRPLCVRRYNNDYEFRKHQMWSKYTCGYLKMFWKGKTGYVFCIFTQNTFVFYNPTFDQDNYDLTFLLQLSHGLYNCKEVFLYPDVERDLCAFQLKLVFDDSAEDIFIHTSSQLQKRMWIFDILKKLTNLIEMPMESPYCVTLNEKTGELIEKPSYEFGRSIDNDEVFMLGCTPKRLEMYPKHINDITEIRKDNFLVCTKEGIHFCHSNDDKPQKAIPNITDCRKFLNLPPPRLYSYILGHSPNMIAKRSILGVINDQIFILAGRKNSRSVSKIICVEVLNCNDPNFEVIDITASADSRYLIGLIANGVIVLGLDKHGIARGLRSYFFDEPIHYMNMMGQWSSEAVICQVDQSFYRFNIRAKYFAPGPLFTNETVSKLMQEIVAEDPNAILQIELIGKKNLEKFMIVLKNKIYFVCNDEHPAIKEIKLPEGEALLRVDLYSEIIRIITTTAIKYYHLSLTSAAMYVEEPITVPEGFESVEGIFKESEICVKIERSIHKVISKIYPYQPDFLILEKSFACDVSACYNHVLLEKLRSSLYTYPRKIITPPQTYDNDDNGEENYDKKDETKDGNLEEGKYDDTAEMKKDTSPEHKDSLEKIKTADANDEGKCTEIQEDTCEGVATSQSVEKEDSFEILDDTPPEPTDSCEKVKTADDTIKDNPAKIIEDTNIEHEDSCEEVKIAAPSDKGNPTKISEDTNPEHKYSCEGDETAESTKNGNSTEMLVDTSAEPTDSCEKVKITDDTNNDNPAKITEDTNLEHKDSSEEIKTPDASVKDNPAKIPEDTNPKHKDSCEGVETAESTDKGNSTEILDDTPPKPTDSCEKVKTADDTIKDNPTEIREGNVPIHRDSSDDVTTTDVNIELGMNRVKFQETPRTCGLPQRTNRHECNRQYQTSEASNQLHSSSKGNKQSKGNKEPEGNKKPEDNKHPEDKKQSNGNIHHENNKQPNGNEHRKGNKQSEDKKQPKGNKQLSSNKHKGKKKPSKGNKRK